MHPRIQEVTERLIERSRPSRQRYLAQMAGAASDGPQRGKLQCANCNAPMLAFDQPIAKVSAGSYFAFLTSTTSLSACR